MITSIPYDIEKVSYFKSHVSNYAWFYRFPRSSGQSKLTASFPATLSATTPTRSRAATSTWAALCSQKSQAMQSTSIRMSRLPTLQVAWTRQNPTRFSCGILQPLHIRHFTTTTIPKVVWYGTSGGYGSFAENSKCDE